MSPGSTHISFLSLVIHVLIMVVETASVHVVLLSPHVRLLCNLRHADQMETILRCMYDVHACLFLLTFNFDYY